jgi:lipopolysaccharide biosynthesis glycosyltransferase
MQKKINKIVIACFKNDMFLLRPCVASIRYWYPDVEIFLLKDIIKGDFNLDEFIHHWGCKIFPTKMKKFGWPWSKLSILLEEDDDRYLFLDSDTVFLGPVLDELDKIEEDFIVTGSKIADPNDENFRFNYIDVNEIEAFDKSYKFPGYGFNGGQIVMKSGVFKLEDFKPIIDFEPTIQSKYPHIFKHGDQGCLNFIFAKAANEKRISIKYFDFWAWPDSQNINDYDLNSIKLKKGYPIVLHWAGVKYIDYRDYSRYDVLKFYTDEYYKKIPLGGIKYFLAHSKILTITYLKLLKYNLLGMKYTKAPKRK